MKKTILLLDTCAVYGGKRIQLSVVFLTLTLINILAVEDTLLNDIADFVSAFSPNWQESG